MEAHVGSLACSSVVYRLRRMRFPCCFMSAALKADLASVREQLEARNAALETVRGAMATLQVNYDALRASHEATQAAATQQAMEAEAERVEAEVCNVSGGSNRMALCRTQDSALPGLGGGR